MELILRIRKAILAHYFWQFKNGKFLMVEGLYMYMVVACMILTYGVLFHYNTIQIIPFMLPFLFGAYQIFGKIKVKDNSGKIKRFFAKILNPLLFSKIKDIHELDGHWLTQLRMLKHPALWLQFNSEEDLRFEIELEQKFMQTYLIDFNDTEVVAGQKLISLILVLSCLLVVYFYT
jgi:hypothetical protein